MEMTLTVHVPRRRPHPVDVVVRWSGRHTAEDLCAGLAEHLAVPVGHLSARGVAIPPDAVVGEPPLLHGAEVTVTVAGPRPAGDRHPLAETSLLQLAVVGGPDAGHARALSPPAVRVGRAPASGLVVADETLSRVHAVVRVDTAGVVVEDEGSTNGVVVDGRPAAGPTPLDTSSTIAMGASTLRLRRAPGPGGPVVARGDGRLLLRPPRPAPAATGAVDVAGPDPPPDRHRVRIPWVAALVPVPVGVGLAFLLGPQLLAFALLGPVMLLSSSLGDRWGAGRARRRDAVRHAAAERRARASLTQALAAERARLDRTHPDPHAVLQLAEHRLPGLWSGGESLPLRLGLGDVATRVTWLEGGTRSRPRAPHTPVVVSLSDIGCLGVVGPADLTAATVRALVGQLCATQPPDRVGIALTVADPSECSGWEWSELLPQGIPPPAPGDVDTGFEPAAAGDPTVRVLVVPDGSAAGAAARVRRARAAGWLVVVAAEERGPLTADCGAVLTVEPGGGSLETGAGPAVRLVVDGVGPWWVDRVSRALAPLACAPAPSGHGPQRLPLPDRVVLDEVLPPGATAPVALVEGWRAATGTAGGLAPAVAVVGVGPDGAHRVDLARDGPHVLVGGTTGSGKSEFLRTLVTSLAVSSSPGDLNLVLVDFKGGAAFGPCAGLPHVVGLVTDLDDHLAARALVSLRAELRRREQLLVAEGVQDVETYARTPRARLHPVPRLVVVVDELRTLVDEVPDFVNGLVRLAAQGRSLGIHLVLATQRPAGAVTAEVQANVSLRVAFRVRDRTDSVAIVEDGAAADIRPGTPGRAVSRGADGVLRVFQAALLGPPPDEDEAHTLEVLPSGADRVGAARPHARDTELDHRPLDHRQLDHHQLDHHQLDHRQLDHSQRARRTAEVVAAVASAHRLTGAPDPRRPWVPALPASVSLQDLPALAGAGPAEPGAVAVGLVDEPDLQRTAPLSWHPAGGTWLLAGRPGSGRTGALRAVVIAAATEHSPAALHVHLVDPGGGLGDLTALPQVGTRVAGAEHRALRALVDHLQRLVTARRHGRAGSGLLPDAVVPTVLVVVDGWEQLLEAHPETSGPGVTEDLLRVLRDGAAVGVVAAVSGGRALLHPRWAALAGSTIALGPLDPLDVALAGLRSADVPRDPPPGRGIRLRDRREVQLALVAAEDLTSRAPHAQPAPGGPWRYRPLPHRVLLPGAPGREAPSPEVAGVAGAPIGVFGEAQQVFCWEPDVHGRVLLVAGPVRSGRSTAVRVLATSLAARGRTVVVVSRSGAGPVPAALPQPPGVPGAHGTRGAPGECGVRRDAAAGSITVVGPDDVGALVRARRRTPALAVLVDDADLLDDAPVTPVLHEVLDLVERDGGLLVAATTSTHLATRFRGLDVAVARRRAGLLLQPSRGDGEHLGVPGLHGLPEVPGRGVFVAGGSVTEVQVFLLPEWPGGGSGAGADARVRPGALLSTDPERRDGGPRGGREHEPPDERLVALHEPDPHRHEKGAPDQRRRPGPLRPDQPPSSQGRQTETADEDEHRRHEDPGRVAALADDELDDVERRERGESRRLDAGEGSGEAAGAG